MQATTETYRYSVTGQDRDEVHRHAKEFARLYFGAGSRIVIHDVTVAVARADGRASLYNAECLAWLPEETDER